MRADSVLVRAVQRGVTLFHRWAWPVVGCTIYLSIIILRLLGRVLLELRRHHIHIVAAVAVLLLIIVVTRAIGLACIATLIAIATLVESVTVLRQ